MGDILRSVYLLFEKVPERKKLKTVEELIHERQDHNHSNVKIA